MVNKGLLAALIWRCMYLNARSATVAVSENNNRRMP
jgi:hypothetical protein